MKNLTSCFVRRAAVAAGIVGFMFACARADVPVSAYVQDGLVALYDARENAGAGQHDATAMSSTVPSRETSPERTIA